jgi:hypothetical protein
LNIAGGGAGAGRFVTSNVASTKGGSSWYGGGDAFPTSAGTKNTGGGGGGGASITNGDAVGGAGGSGFIVIKYINKPTFNRQPVSDTITVGAVETFTVNTSAPVSPVTKTVKWQFTADTTTVVEANISGWTNVSTGTGYNTDTFTTVAATKAIEP